MAGELVPHYQNDEGVPTIEIGVREFKCIGASPPFDHPHVFIDMGEEDFGICPYCATGYRYRAEFRPDQTAPPGHLVPAMAH